MIRRWIGLSWIAMLLAGCQSADELATAELSAGIAATSATTASSEQPGGAATVEGDHDQSAARQVAAEEFDPPFPNRTTLFEPPRGGQNTVRRDEEYGETIELKGFVDVNGPQVVLAIDGILSPIPEGGEMYGVQVISIHPPSVVLQRGRNRWTASLE